MWALGFREPAIFDRGRLMNEVLAKANASIQTNRSNVKRELEIKLKSLILAQIERWRHALHMQVERQRGGNPGGERRTGE